MINFEEFREKLDRNRIFFEVFASTFIAIGGIALAFASYIVSKESVRLTESQIYPSLFLTSNQLTKKELAPDENIASDEILIINAGGTARNLKVSTVSLLEVVVDKTGATKCIILNNYFDFLKEHHDGTEVVARVRRNERGNYSELKKIAPDIALGQNPLYESASVTTLLKLEYIKVGGERAVKYLSFNRERATPQQKLTPLRFVTLPNRCDYAKDIRYLTTNDLNELAR